MSSIHDVSDTTDGMDFKASLPPGTGQSFTKIVLVHPVILFHDDRQRHGRHCSVYSLMSSYKGNIENPLFQILLHIFSLDRDDLALMPFLAGVNFKIPAIEINAGLFLVGLFFQLFQATLLGCRYYRNTFLNNTGLLVSNFLERIAQVFHMVHGHVCDDGNHRSNDVGGIVESSHADFHNSIVYFLFFEIPESHGCKEFKFRGRFYAICYSFLCRFANNGSCLRKIFPGNIMSTDINPFCIIHQMGRNIASHPKCSIFQYTGDHGGDAAFAVCSGNMDYFVGSFRVSQFRKHRLDSLQPRFNAKRSCLFKPGHRFFVIHNFSFEYEIVWE